MASDMYMKIDGIKGESKDSNHKEWIDIKSFTWGAEQPGSMTTGGGGGSGRVNFDDLVVIASIDKSAPTLLQSCASGKHISKLEISVCKAGGEQVEYYRETLEDLIVTSVKFIGTEDDETLMMQYSFQAVGLKAQYWEQTDKGSKGAEVSMGWDTKANKSK